MIITWIVAGAAIAGGGWLFHHVVRTRAAVDELELRLKALEEK